MPKTKGKNPGKMCQLIFLKLYPIGKMCQLIFLKLYPIMQTIT